MSENLKEKITFKEIDQLENAVNAFSRSTNWIKKLSVTLVSTFGIPLFTNQISFQSMAFILFVIIFLAWILDAYCFYFQRNLRVRIEQKYKVLDSWWPYGLSETKKVGGMQALFNKSHILYYVFLGLFFIPFLSEFLKIVCDCCKNI